MRSAEQTDRPAPGTQAEQRVPQPPPKKPATVALGLGRPFMEELASRRLLPDWLVEDAKRSDPEDRFSLPAAMQMLETAAAICGDPDLGLHAALRMSLEPQLLEYTAVSCETGREAYETMARYIVVVNEGLEVTVRVEGDLAVVAFEDHGAMNRIAVDFTLASVYLLHLRWGAPGARERTSVEFRYRAPTDVRVHHELFGADHVSFGAPRHALCFPAAWLEEPLCSADRRLHAVLLRSLNERLDELPVRQGLTQKVRALLRETPLDHGLHSQLMAERLEMSPRTLTRRLEAEGTTFRTLLDEARCAETLRCLLGDRLSVRETAQRVGFADTTAFYKAFRRWFDMTPSEYIEARTRG